MRREVQGASRDAACPLLPGNGRLSWGPADWKDRYVPISGPSPLLSSIPRGSPGRQDSDCAGLPPKPRAAAAPRHQTAIVADSAKAVLKPGWRMGFHE